MPRKSADEAVPPQRKGQQHMGWSGIGINAVAAASIYCDHNDARRGTRCARLAFPNDEPEYATD